jgi:hypothetical protein
MQLLPLEKLNFLHNTTSLRIERKVFILKDFSKSCQLKRISNYYADSIYPLDETDSRVETRRGSYCSKSTLTPQEKVLLT